MSKNKWGTLLDAGRGEDPESEPAPSPTPPSPAPADAPPARSKGGRPPGKHSDDERYRQCAAYLRRDQIDAVQKALIDLKRRPRFEFSQLVEVLLAAWLEDPGRFELPPEPPRKPKGRQAE